MSLHEITADGVEYDFMEECEHCHRGLLRVKYRCAELSIYQYRANGIPPHLAPDLEVLKKTIIPMLRAVREVDPGRLLCKKLITMTLLLLVKGMTLADAVEWLEQRRQEIEVA